jgi:signal transduction histidine kinase/AraC-like DNA-binding protein
MVKASNNDEIWNDTPRTLEIKILAPWWKTNLALFIFILITLTTVLIIYNFLNVRLKERQQIKKEREERAQDEALNAKKIQFFTNISHEFRTPLTLILNPLEAIIENKSVQLPHDISEKHATIYKNSKRLSRLIDELMDFRKLQFNKMSINASKFEIVKFVKEVVSHFEEEAVQRNIILSVESQQENTAIWADPSMIEKIIFNLLSNAFKATKDNGMVSINIQVPLQPIDFPLLNDKEDFYGIEISILDSGIGIDKKDLEHIFTRFYQSNEMDKQYYGGTGIGLEVVKNFIDLHMGIIEVRSEQKKGTEFKILLPLGSKHLNLSKTDSNSKTNDEIYQQINKSEINLETANNGERNKKTVLIVEDNSELRNYLKNELKEDYKVKIAINGKEGLQMAIKFIPDLVISDVMMPIMDGFEMCHKIKNDIRISHIPLLMLTAKGMQIDRVKGIDSGADVYLNKPYNMDVLKAHLSQLISSRQILFNKYYNGVSDKELRNTTSLDKQFITNILEYIHENITDPALNVENLADKLLISRSKLYRKIKALTGNTANEFIKKIRLEKAKQFLENSDYSISEISYKIGFSSPSYFTKCYKIQFGILPTDVRQTET